MPEELWYGSGCQPLTSCGCRPGEEQVANRWDLAVHGSPGSLTVANLADRFPGWQGRVAACLPQAAAVAVVGSHNLLMPTVPVAVAVEP